MCLVPWPQLLAPTVSAPASHPSALWRLSAPIPSSSGFPASPQSVVEVSLSSESHQSLTHLSSVFQFLLLYLVVVFRPVHVPVDVTISPSPLQVVLGWGCSMPLQSCGEGGVTALSRTRPEVPSAGYLAEDGRLTAEPRHTSETHPPLLPHHTFSDSLELLRDSFLPHRTELIKTAFRTQSHGAM